MIKASEMKKKAKKANEPKELTATEIYQKSKDKLLQSLSVDIQKAAGSGRTEYSYDNTRMKQKIINHFDLATLGRKLEFEKILGFLINDLKSNGYKIVTGRNFTIKWG
jgi:hypothetical protein